MLAQYAGNDTTKLIKRREKQNTQSSARKNNWPCTTHVLNPPFSSAALLHRNYIIHTNVILKQLQFHYNPGELRPYCISHGSYFRKEHTKLNNYVVPQITTPIALVALELIFL